MSCYRIWNKSQHKIHDDNVDKVLKRGDSAIECANAIYDNFESIAKHITDIVKVSGANPKNVVSTLDPRLDLMLTQLAKMGQDIFKTPVRDMDKQEIKAHHDALRAILPLLKKNADYAAKLAGHWNQMHSQLTAVTGLFKR
jgi:hypothetical protein